MEKKIEKIGPIDIPKKYEKSESFQSYYVNGALGGFNNKYDMRLAFYKINTLEHLLSTRDNEAHSKEEAIQNLIKNPMPHDILCEIIMSKEAAKELFQFPKRQLEQLEKIERTIENEN